MNGLGGAGMTAIGLLFEVGIGNSLTVPLKAVLIYQIRLDTLLRRIVANADERFMKGLFDTIGLY
jgi:hypothetical protein